MALKEKCAICNGKIQFRFSPMEEWEIKGSLCGECYSKKLNEHYPGDHVRVNKHLD
ncbi:MAG: hypothetical protein ACRBB5_02805 [Nitrosopumilus sp.]